MSTNTDCQGLLVPFAHALTGDTTLPEAAERERGYRCPFCSGAVRRRDRAGARTHFYHLNSDDQVSCVNTGPTRETREHLATKYRLQAALQSSLNEATLPPLEVQCPFCRTTTPVTLRLPEFDEVVVEASLNTGGLRPDVLLRAGGIDVFAFEVRATHAVDRRKAQNFSLPWIEIRASRRATSRFTAIAGHFEQTDIGHCHGAGCGATAAEMTHPPQLPAVVVDCEAKCLDSARGVKIQTMHRHNLLLNYLDTKPNIIIRLNRRRQLYNFADHVVRAEAPDGTTWFFDGTQSPAVELDREAAKQRVFAVTPGTAQPTGAVSPGHQPRRRPVPHPARKNGHVRQESLSLAKPPWYPTAPLVYAERYYDAPHWYRNWYFDRSGLVYGYQLVYYEKSRRAQVRQCPFEEPLPMTSEELPEGVRQGLRRRLQAVLDADANREFQESGVERRPKD